MALSVPWPKKTPDLSSCLAPRLMRSRTVTVDAARFTGLRAVFLWDTLVMSKSSTWIWILLAIIAAGVGVWVAKRTSDQAPQLTSGTWLPQPRPLPEFSLTSEKGQPFTLQGLK